MKKFCAVSLMIVFSAIFLAGCSLVDLSKSSNSIKEDVSTEESLTSSIIKNENVSSNDQKKPELVACEKFGKYYPKEIGRCYFNSAWDTYDISICDEKILVESSDENWNREECIKMFEKDYALEPTGHHNNPINNIQLGDISKGKSFELNVGESAYFEMKGTEYELIFLRNSIDYGDIRLSIQPSKRVSFGMSDGEEAYLNLSEFGGSSNTREKQNKDLLIKLNGVNVEEFEVSLHLEEI